MSSSFLQFKLSYETPIKDAFMDKTHMQVWENNARANFHILGSAATVLLAALGLQYRADTGSSSKDHPKVMAVGIGSLIGFFMGCIIEQNYLRTARHSSTLLYHFVRSMGYISVASLASVFFSTFTSLNMSLIVVYIIFSLLFSAEWVLEWVRYKCSHRNRESLPMYVRLRHSFDTLLVVPEYK